MKPEQIDRFHNNLNALRESYGKMFTLSEFYAIYSKGITYCIFEGRKFFMDNVYTTKI